MFAKACVICLPRCLALGAALGPGCPPLKMERKQTLVRYVQRKYHLPQATQIVVSDIPGDEIGCYRKLRFAVSGKPQLDISLYLTPYQRFLVPELNDSTVDPNVEEERRRLAARKELEKDDGRPALGPADAPVTIVVFSDFQCPYCRKFAETMKQVVSEEKRVRFLFEICRWICMLGPSRRRTWPLVFRCKTAKRSGVSTTTSSTTNKSSTRKACRQKCENSYVLYGIFAPIKRSSVRTGARQRRESQRTSRLLPKTRFRAHRPFL